MSRLHTTNLGSLVSVNGVQVPKGCSTLSITYQDTSDSDSGRSGLTGSMWKGYIGTLRTLKCVWNSLYPDHIREILQAVKGLNKFPVQFYDPESGEYVTSDFYVGDRSTDIKTFYRNHELIGLNLTLIENDPYADGNGDTGEGGGIVPEGTITITNNGLHQVTKYEMADVKVPPYGEGEVEIKTNGRHSVSGKAVAVVNVPAGGGGITPSGTIEIDSNGKHDVTDYAEADVQVPPYGVGETSISSNGDHDVSGKATAKVNVPPYGVGEIEINDNGRVDVSGKATAVVNVPTGITPEGTVTITENGVKDVTQYAKADVKVPPYGEGDVQITENGTHDVSGKARAIVNVPTGGEGSNPVSPEQVYQDTRPKSWMLMPTPEPDSIYMLIVGSGVAYVAFTASSLDGSDMQVSIGTVDESGAYTSRQELTEATSGRTSKYAIDMNAYEWSASSDGKNRQIMMRIGGQISKFESAYYGSFVQGAASMIVDVSMSTPHITSIKLGYYTAMRYVYIDAYGDNVVDLSKCFQRTGSRTTHQLLCIRYLRCIASSLRETFRDCNMLKSVDLAHIDTSQVESMSYMLDGCSELTSVDVSHFNTSHTIGIGYMFSRCSRLTSIDVSNFDTSQVTHMTSTFSGCSGLTELDVSGFNTSKVMYMNNMFEGCSGLTELDVSGFNTSKVTSMNNMFEGCSGLTELDVSGFNTSKVTSMNNMFEGCSGLTELDVSGFNTSKVTSMNNMFEGCSSLVSLNIAWENMTSVNSMSSFFAECFNLRHIVFRPDTIGWKGVDMQLESMPISVDGIDAMIASLPTITENHKISANRLIVAADITPEMIAAAAAKNWTIDT